MQNLMENISSTTQAIQQINTLETTSNITTAFVMFCIVSIVVSIINLYRKVEKIIEEKIDEKIKPSVDILHETVFTVKQLEHVVTEMNATLTILKDILLKEKNK